MYEAELLSRSGMVVRCSILAIVVAVLVGLPASASAKSGHCTSGRTVLRVGTFNGKKGPCKTIQEAVDAIGPGGWILIGPGDYKQSSSRSITGAFGDDRAGAAGVVSTPPNPHPGIN